MEKDKNISHLRGGVKREGSKDRHTDQTQEEAQKESQQSEQERDWVHHPFAGFSF